MPDNQVVYLGLGSNQNNPRQQLVDAIHLISISPRIDVINCSSFYISNPVDGSCQSLFWNAVIRIKTTLLPLELLDLCLQIEKEQHRIRTVRWGPRTLDIDILLFGQITIDVPHCTIPHKEMLHRDFVLMPLYEIDPDLILPNGTSLASCYRNAPNNILRKQPFSRETMSSA